MDRIVDGRDHLVRPGVGRSLGGTVVGDIHLQIPRGGFGQSHLGGAVVGMSQAASHQADGGRLVFAADRHRELVLGRFPIVVAGLHGPDGDVARLGHPHDADAHQGSGSGRAGGAGHFVGHRREAGRSVSQQRNE